MRSHHSAMYSSLQRRFVFVLFCCNLFVFQPSFGFHSCCGRHYLRLPSTTTTSTTNLPLFPISPSFRNVVVVGKNNPKHTTTVTTTTTLFGYKFGDFTKGMINQVTGKKEYEFGKKSTTEESSTERYNVFSFAKSSKGL